MYTSKNEAKIEIRSRMLSKIVTQGMNEYLLQNLKQECVFILFVCQNKLLEYNDLFASGEFSLLCIVDATMCNHCFQVQKSSKQSHLRADKNKTTRLACEIYRVYQVKTIDIEEVNCIKDKEGIYQNDPLMLYLSSYSKRVYLKQRNLIQLQPKLIMQLQCWSKDQLLQQMKTQLQLDRKPLPSHLQKQHHPPSFLQLIKSKKAQFSKKLSTLQVSEISLPHINHLSQQENLTIQTQNNNQLKEHEQYIENGVRTPQASGIYRFRSILDYGLQVQKRKTSENEGMKYRSSLKWSINSSKIGQPIPKTIEKTKRTTTQTKQKGTIQYAHSNKMNSNRKIEDKEEVLNKISQQITKFQQAVETIPKNMKLRNEENLAATASHLQNFNPFFNRNARIVNICLLKMGKVVHKPASTILYKSGEQIDHFYIIMHGRVKLVEGAFRRVCQTGETILEQVLFTDKIKKTALQRAKTLGSTHFLCFKIEEYKKLKQQLISHGLRLGWHEMQSIIKRNFIVKNWMRNKKKLQSNK